MNLVVKLASFFLFLNLVGGQKLVCFYDSGSQLRSGLGKMLLPDVELAAQFCTHLIYGYAGINPNSYQISSLNVDLDMWHYRQITALKSKFPGMKILLSVGGDKDNDEQHPNKYIEFLESGPEKHKEFALSAIEVLRINGFDGLDLAFQLPRNKPRKVHSKVGMILKKFKKLFTGDFIVDKNSDMHREQYTEFVNLLHENFSRNNLTMSMTVLPNVNSTWYFDVPKIESKFDFINLAAFDFLTPERNPFEADYTAPIYPLEEQNRLPHYNIDYQVKYWTQQCPSNKIVLGIASYGRVWKLTKDSGVTGAPVVPETDGPADHGHLTNSSGLYSWPEICAKFPNKVNELFRGEKAPLRKVADLEQKYGNYALRPADEEGNFGLWLSYDDPDFAGTKTSYAKRNALGGIALFDLSLDDFRGLCTGQKFPILRTIKYFL